MKIAVLVPNKPFWGARIVQIPFLRALRAAFPEATVRLHSPVKDTAELVAQDLADEHRTYRRSTWTRVLADLRKWWPDRVYNLRRKSTGCCVATAAAGGRRIGYDGGFFSRFLDERYPYDSHVYMATRYLALVDPEARVGPDDGSIRLFRSWMEARIGNRPFGAPRVLFLPGAGSPEKKWPLDRFLALAPVLAERIDGGAVFVTGPREREEHERISAAAGVELVDSPSVDALLRLIEGAALVVSNDNGPSHLAQLSGRRFLGLYLAGRSTVEDWFLDRPNADLLVTASRAGMESLSLERVREAALGVLERAELAQTLVPFSRAEAARPRARPSRRSPRQGAPPSAASS